MIINKINFIGIFVKSFSFQIFFRVYLFIIITPPLSEDLYLRFFRNFYNNILMTSLTFVPCNNNFS